MGGRGSISSGGKGFRSMTDEQLDSEIKRLGKVMEDTVDDHVANVDGRRINQDATECSPHTRG